MRAKRSAYFSHALDLCLCVCVCVCLRCLSWFVCSIFFSCGCYLRVYLATPFAACWPGGGWRPNRYRSAGPLGRSQSGESCAHLLCCAFLSRRIHTHTHARIDAANLFIVCDQWLFVTESAAVLVSTQTLQTTAEWRPGDGKVLCCVGGAVLSLLALLLARSFPLSRALHTRWRVIMPHPPPAAVCVRLTADSHTRTATADWRVLSQRYTARCFRWPAYRRVWHCCRCSQRHR